MMLQERNDLNDLDFFPFNHATSFASSKDDLKLLTIATEKSNRNFLLSLSFQGQSFQHFWKRVPSAYHDLHDSLLRLTLIYHVQPFSCDDLPSVLLEEDAAWVVPSFRVFEQFVYKMCIRTYYANDRRIRL